MDGPDLGSICRATMAHALLDMMRQQHTKQAQSQLGCPHSGWLLHEGGSNPWQCHLMQHDSSQIQQDTQTCCWCQGWRCCCCWCWQCPSRCCCYLYGCCHKLHMLLGLVQLLLLVLLVSAPGALACCFRSCCMALLLLLLLLLFLLVLLPSQLTDGAALVHRLSDHIHDAAQCAATHRHLQQAHTIPGFQELNSVSKAQVAVCCWLLRYYQWICGPSVNTPQPCMSAQAGKCCLALLAPPLADAVPLFAAAIAAPTPRGTELR